MQKGLLLGCAALLIAGFTTNAQAGQPRAHSQTLTIRQHTTNAAPIAGRVIRLHSSAFVQRFTKSVAARTSILASRLTRDALRFIGVPYSFGGTSSAGFDCSGFVQHVYALVGIRIPRMADAQYYAGRRTRGGMHPGDLVFFQTYEPGPSHVGIYLGNGEFVHASSSHGVMVSHLSESYWSSRYLGAKRLIASR